MGSEHASPLAGLTGALERARALDGIVRAIDPIVASAVGKGARRRVLSGAWLGHALHPLLTDVPIGAWTSALTLDLIGGESSGHAADLLVGVGLAAFAPTAISGWSDWGATGTPEQRRVGLAHAAVNVAAATIFAASLLRRREGRRGAGKRLGAAGAAVLGAGGYLGGHLSYAQGAGAGRR
ncbi:MAG: DUF2231 domain-containing protein [Solirubrobacteraceae bacterium]